MKSHVLHTVWCYISDEAGEIWNWSLLGVKGLTCSPAILRNSEHSNSILYVERKGKGGGGGGGGLSVSQFTVFSYVSSVCTWPFAQFSYANNGR